MSYQSWMDRVKVGLAGTIFLHRRPEADECMKYHDSIDGVISELSALRADLKEARKVVNEQAEDAGLWFEAKTAPEAYLQAALRKLHAVIEKDRAFLARVGHE